MRLAWIVIVAWCAPAAAAPDVTSIAAGPAYTCATLADGTVWCWGLNAEGELGDGTTLNRSVPVRVTNIADAVEVAAARERACARRRDGTVACWGVIAPTTTVLKATAIPATEIAQVAGPCMRTTAGTAACLSGAGQVVPITDATEVVDVAAQDGSGCVVRRKGEVACWWSPEYVAHPVRAPRRPHRHLLGRELHRPDRNLRDRLDRATDRGRVVSYRPNFDDANTVSSS